MRTALKIALGFFGENPYAPVIETEPTVFLGFEYRKINGVQVLFQDAACTIPVEEIGDPVGGYRDFETGEILAVQTTDANRPIWGGIGVGLVLSGAQSLGFTLPLLGSSFATLFQYRRNSIPSEEQYFMDSSGDNRFIVGIRSEKISYFDGGWQTSEISPIVTGEKTNIGLSFSPFLGRIVQNGETDSQPYTPLAVGGSAAIGSRHTQTAAFFEGSIQSAIFYDRSFNIEDLGELLGRLP